MQTPEEFWQYVDKTATCWLWMGGRLPHTHPYGFCNYNGKTVRAHRQAWILTYGAIPAGLWVLHHCDNPPCCRPEHLYLGTIADNTRDTHARNRYPLGEEHYNARLTAQDIHTIRILAQGGTLQKDIAQQFGIQQQTVSKIVRYKIRKTQ